MSLQIVQMPSCHPVFTAGWHYHCDKEGMQNEISQLFNGLFTQNLGMADSNSVLALSLAAPGIIMFVVLFFGRELFRPRWRGYWDAV